MSPIRTVLVALAFVVVLGVRVPSVVPADAGPAAAQAAPAHAAPAHAAPAHAARVHAAPAQATARVFLPLVGRFGVDDLAPPTTPEPPWRYLSNTNGVRDVATDPRTGELWLAIAGGLVRFAPSSGEHVVLTHHPLAHVAVDTLGSVWIDGGPGGEAEGVSRRSSDGTWQRLTRAEGLQGAQLTDIVADGAGNVWIAYRDLPAGPARVGPNGTLTVYGTDDGLPDLGITAIASDRAGGVWLSHETGFELDPCSELGLSHISAGGVVETYGNHDGVPACSPRLLAVDLDGVVYALREPTAESIGPDVFQRLPDGRDGRRR